ncbi:MAG: S41 family peptidase [Turicibacter sp.]|nr:S41 family peptidase [Turicibacter sp.]
MKKILLSLVSLLVFATLVACSGDVESVELEIEIEQEYVGQTIANDDVEFAGLEIGFEQTAEDNADNATPITQVVEFCPMCDDYVYVTINTVNNLDDAEQFTTEDFLYDIEFLVRNLEENFPFFGVIGRHSGDSNPLDTFRTFALSDLSTVDYPEFLSTIRRGFNANFFGTAHLDFNPSWDWRVNANPLFCISDSTRIQPLTQNFNRPLQTYSRVIEEGRIALIMTPPEFFNNSTAPPRIMREMQDFIREVQGYEHIIIDLRHIGGGWLTNFIYAFISPNISEPLSFYEFAFITDGERAQRIHSDWHFIRPRNIDLFFLRNVATPLVSADLFVEQHNLVNMNADDFGNLVYGFLLETFVHPTPGSLRLPLLADNIWLLIGPRNFSAAEISGRIAREAGFTLVGEQTGNRNSEGRVHFTLPRTGNVVAMDTFYVTDSTGRNIEEFPLEPHYFNRDGMDALETVLAIIAERSE